MGYGSIDNYNKFCEFSISDIKNLEQYGTETLQKQLIPGKWTMIQLVDHLLSIEKGILMYMTKKSADPALHKVKFKNRFKHFLTKLVLRSGKKIKAPAVVPDPSNEKDIATMLAEFEKVRSRTRDFISKWGAERKNDLIFRHPFAGMFTLNQTISFLAEHWEHHRPQQQQLLKNIK